MAHGTQMNYKSQKTDARVRTVFSTPLNDYKATKTLVISTWLYKRYDFLTDLLNMKKELKKETQPLLAQAAKEIIAEIDKAVPKLEAAKKQNLPLGQPHDWGTDL